jgi:multiple sugar transport system permease protein
MMRARGVPLEAAQATVRRRQRGMMLAGDTTAGKTLFLGAYLILGTWALVSLFPMYWMIITALKPGGLVVETPPTLVPPEPTLAHFRELFDSGVLRWTVNTLIVASSVTIAQLLFASMAGYAFAKKQFPGKEVLFWVYVSSMIIPIYALVVPLYRLMDNLHLLNSYLGLILPGVAAPFGVFLMRQFIQTLPTEILDAGRIDGCSEWGLFWKIVLPLAKPGLAVLGIFAFTEQWASFFWPLVITSSSDMNVLTVGIASLQAFDVTSGVKDYGLMMAGATWSAIPMIAVFFLFQRYFVRGITLGAIKG